MQNQNYKTHLRFVPIFHFVLYPVILGCITASIWMVYTAFYITHEDKLVALTIGMLSLALLFVCYYARAFALKAQDRAIRAEENLRHFVLTGKLLDNRLTISQVIALRFASDSEFLVLAGRAAEEGLKAVEIKRAIVNWRADHHRA